MSSTIVLSKDVEVSVENASTDVLDRIDFRVTPQTFARNADASIWFASGVQIRQGEISADSPQDAVLVWGCERCIGTEGRHEKASQQGCSATVALLLRIGSFESPLEQVWRNLRLLYGGIEEILSVLASTFRTSLLRSYRNLERWPATKHT
jgi:hypothetical protein